MSFTPDQVARLLAASAEAIHDEVVALPVSVAGWHPAPGEWCANQVVGHLIEAEQRGFAGRIRIILASKDPRLERWDPDEVSRARRDCERDETDLVRRFLASRGESLRLFPTLSAADLERGGEHPTVGYLRLRDLIHEWVHHDRNHLKQILSNVQLAAWPAMGNARKFSAD